MRIIKINILIVLIAELIVIGWLTATSEMENWWLKEKEVPEYAITYKAPRLEELSVEKQIKRIFKDDTKMALAISQAENSTRQCDRVGISGDIGVFQINPIHSWRGNLYDCTENIKIAKQIFDEQGWWPWAVYRTGIYQNYLRIN